jgi:Taurine catabolism dioxygenase TauD, TfdA family
MTGLDKDGSTLAHVVSDIGWLRINVSSQYERLRDEVLRIGRALGDPYLGRYGRLLEKLSPVPTSNANRCSLSALHGTATLPPHIDGAHRSKPPRFIILACENPGSCPVPTLLTHFEELGLTPTESVECKTAPFLIRNGRKSFYSTIIDSSRAFIRFDLGCMEALDEMAFNIAHVISARAVLANSKLIEWVAGDILIIDNWHVLHRRGLPNLIASTDRQLIRVSVQ